MNLSAHLLALVLAHTPAAQVVEHRTPAEMACVTVALTPGADWFLGLGQSMEPLYAPGTAIVVRPIQYRDIKTGMTVLYEKADGLRVAHVVIGEDARGYIVQGLANSVPDPESVNEHNLIGVVVKAFAPL